MANMDGTKQPALLHVYAQGHEHDDLYVIGNRDGLEKLKKAVEKALTQEVGKESVITNDGEGFDAVVALCDEGWQSDAWINMKEPYAAESSRDARDNAVSPWAFVRSKRKCADLENKALEFATKSHEGQFRKDGVTPYITHPIRVRNRASVHPKFTPEMGAAAFLHDVVEDCGVTVDQLRDQFGDKVAELVDHMTNRSKQTGLPREQRKKIDRDRLALAPQDAKILKLFDRIDNLSDAATFQGSFRRLYANESLELVKILQDADPKLAEELTKLAKDLLKSA
jgi:hypothetical protein